MSAIQFGSIAKRCIHREFVKNNILQVIRFKISGAAALELLGHFVGIILYNVFDP